MHHKEQDNQSLMLHKAAIDLMQRDDAFRQRAIDILRRWSTLPMKNYKSQEDEWLRILTAKDWSAALSVSEHGNELRQSSPVACVLPNKLRLEIIRLCKKNNSNT